MRNGLLILIPCLILALAGCGGEGPRPISVSGGTIQIGDVTCEPSHNLIRRLERCGLSPEERQRALKLMLAEKKRRLAEAKKKLSRLRPSKEALTWMARMMYTEAPDMRSMTYVGSTVVERKSLRQYPNTVKNVITQRWAYEGITRGAQNVHELTLEDYGQNLKWNLAIRAAWFTLTAPEEYRPLTGIEHFWSPQSASRTPQWAHGREPEYVLGNKFHFHDLIK
jgi:hypothetical protein